MIVYASTSYGEGITLATSVTHHPASKETAWRQAYRVVLHDITDGACEVVAEETHLSAHIAAWAVYRFTGCEFPDLPAAEGGPS